MIAMIGQMKSNDAPRHSSSVCWTQHRADNDRRCWAAYHSPVHEGGSARAASGRAVAIMVIPRVLSWLGDVHCGHSPEAPIAESDGDGDIDRTDYGLPTVELR